MGSEMCIRDSSKAWVLVVDGSHARRRDVRLGLRSAGWSEVLDGLRAGDRVVSAGANDIRDGSRLRPSPASTAAAEGG